MKTILLVCALVLGLLESAGAYSLGGPIGNNPNPDGASLQGDAWQQGAIGYGLPGDLIAPKNLGEEYRRNTPQIYYACDANFLDYFGSNGAVAMDQACAIFNKAFTNNPTGVARGVDGYSANLVEFPLETRHFNFEAQALGMYDLKSVAMGALMEQMSLADPVRYTWTLHDRIHAANTPPCPGGMEYLVVQRNFDYFSTPLNQLQSSPYVNNVLYSYAIIETCAPPDPLALAVPYSVDPLADTYSPVASSYGGVILVNSGLGLLLSVAPGINSYGAFYTGLTRDDMAGLRYLLRTNNINTESVDASSFLFTISTNTTQAQFPPTFTTNGAAGLYFFDGTFGYGDYGFLVAFSMTNSPAVLQALYPGLIIASSTNYFVTATNYTFNQYFTNTGNGTTFPPPLTLVTVSNAHPFLLEKFVTTFANVFPNRVSPTTLVKQQIITVTPQVGAPFPQPLVTTITTKNIIQNIPSGDFFLLTPFYTNFCPLDIIRVGLTNVTAITNILTGTVTNIVTPTNTSTFSSTLIQITFQTNFSFIIDPVTCTQSLPPPFTYQGIDKIQFVQSKFDSLLGQTFHPITNNYSLVLVSNSQSIVQHFQRIVTQPDIVFSAGDLATGPNSPPAANPTVFEFSRDVTFDQANALHGLAGPGTVTVPSQISFNKSGPVFYNGTFTINDVMDGTPFFTETPGGDITDTFYSFYFVWGSFDASTNPPTVYGDGNSIDSLESQVLIQVTTTPSGPLTGTVNIPLNVQFAASGGAFSTPFTWSSPDLPPGLSITSNSNNTATLTGTPTQRGTYVFTLVLMDTLGRSVSWQFSITIS